MAFIFPLVGAAVSAMGTIAAGNAAQQAATAQAQALNFRAKQEDMAAAESRAAAQRQAIGKRQRVQAGGEYRNAPPGNDGARRAEIEQVMRN